MAKTVIVKQQQNTQCVQLSSEEFFERKMKELLFKIYFGVKCPTGEVKHALGKTIVDLNEFRSTILRSDVKQINEAFEDINMPIMIAEPLFREKTSVRTGKTYEVLDSCSVIIYDKVLDELSELPMIKKYEDRRAERYAIASSIFAKETAWNL